MNALKKNTKKIFSLELAKKLITTLIVVFLFDFFFFPMPTLANDEINQANQDKQVATTSIIQSDASRTDAEQYSAEDEVILQELDKLMTDMGRDADGFLPENKNKPAKPVERIYSDWHIITAYNSEVGQTDDSPCTTANGFNVCIHGKEDTIAANFLSFGSKVRIPDLFGDRVFIVRDRMNSRFHDRLDVWMINKMDAKKFGVRLAKIEVIK